MIFRLLSVVLAGLLACAGAVQAQSKAELLWYSQAAFKLTTQSGKVIMIDPWIMGATKIPPELKDLDKIGKVDLILVTHGHGDHLGDAMEISKRNNAPIWAPAGLNQTLATLG
ncbi:MAG: MBL fold metallo-hydrolase, partial [Reyranella sp.]|nr:MBL fold metallo-hydrolase [Reyranella sp.]